MKTGISLLSYTHTEQVITKEKAKHFKNKTKQKNELAQESSIIFSLTQRKKKCS